MKIGNRTKLYYIFTDYFNGTLLTYLPFYLKNKFHYSGSEYGTLLLIAGFFAIFGIIIGPAIVNKFKKEKSVMLIEFILMALAIIIIYFTNNYLLITFATGLCYLNRMAMYSIGDNMISDIAREDGISFGKIRSFGSIGWGLCFLVNGYLVDENPKLFLVFWFFVSVCAIINLVFLKENKKLNRQASIIKYKTLKEIKKYKKAVSYLFLAMLIYIMIQSSTNFINIFIKNLNGDIKIYSTITAILVIGEFVVMSQSDMIRMKLQNQKYIELILVLLIIKMAIITFASNPIPIYLTTVLDPVIFGLILPFNPSYLKSAVPKKYNATILSLFGIFSLITIALYSKFAGNIMDIFNTRMVFVSFLIISIITFLLSKIYKLDNNTLKEE